MQKSSVLDMVNLLPLFETDNDGESQAVTTLRCGRFNRGVGDITDVFRHRVGLADKFPLNLWTRHRRNFYRIVAVSCYNSSFATAARAIGRVFNVAEPTSPTEPASPKPGNGGLKLLEAVFNVIGEEGIVPEGGRGGKGIVPIGAKSWQR